MDKLQTQTIEALKAFKCKVEWPKEIRAATELLVEECKKMFPYVWALGQLAMGKIYYYETDMTLVSKELFDFNQRFVAWLKKCPAIGQAELEVKFHTNKGTNALTLHSLNAFYPGAFVDTMKAFRIAHLQQMVEAFGDPTVGITVKRPKEAQRHILIAQDWN